jgi:hypothetical protein
MTIKERIIRMLLHLYPIAWRREYGPELRDLLQARVLGAAEIVDVGRGAIRERVLAADAATWIGVTAMLAVAGAIGWNIGAPQPDGGWTGILAPSTKTLPTVLITPFVADVYLLSLGTFGCWSTLSRRTTPARSGLAAMRISLIAGLPVAMAGLLMMAGWLGLIVLLPGDVPSTYHQHGFAYTYYTAGGETPSAVSIVAAPLFRLPEAWLWGAMGGAVGRWMSRMHVRLDA